MNGWLHYDGERFYFIYRYREQGGIWAGVFRREAAGAKGMRERDDAKEREWYGVKHQYFCYLSLPASAAGQTASSIIIAPNEHFELNL